MAPKGASSCSCIVYPTLSFLYSQHVSDCAEKVELQQLYNKHCDVAMSCRIVSPERLVSTLHHQGEVQQQQQGELEAGQEQGADDLGKGQVQWELAADWDEHMLL